MTAKDCKVAVLMGGANSERQVSLDSGKAVAEALSKNKSFDVVEFDVTPENLSVLDDRTVDIFFLALHGSFGEDGQLQKILEDKKLAYTGSGHKASFDAFDKIISQQIFRDNKLNTPNWIDFNQESNAKEINAKLSSWDCDKFIVKPPRQGSSVGIKILDNSAEAIKQAQGCFAEFGNCMIEEFIAGRELTVSILDNQPLDIIEIVVNTEFYDYNAKYLDDDTQYLFNTVGDTSLGETIKANSVKAFELLGCKDFGRVDFILSQNNTPYILEINTLPGMTSHSLLPKAAAKAGMDMTDLCTKIIELAL